MATGAAVTTIKVFIVAIGSAELQELLTCLKKAEISPGQYDNELLADLSQRFAQQIIELALPNPEPVSDLNGTSSFAGSYACYILPAVALAILGLVCSYKLLKVQGWSFDRVMYVTSHSFKNAVETLSKQIESIHASVALAKRLLSEKLGGLDLKVDQLKELSQETWDYLAGVKSELLEIGKKVKHICEVVSKLVEKVEHLVRQQDQINERINRLGNRAMDERNADIALQSIADRNVAARNSMITNTRILGLFGILGEGHNTGRLLGN